MDTEKVDGDVLRRFYEQDYERSDVPAGVPEEGDFTYAQVLEQIRPYLREGMRVLDLGCNDGGLSFYMALKGCHVVGIDLASNAIETAKRGAHRLGVKNAEFYSMDFQREWSTPEMFDLVLCSHVVEHVPDDVQFSRSIARALKHGGNLILLTPTLYSSYYRINKLLFGKCKFDEEVGHLRRYSKESLGIVLEKSGFTIEKVTYLDGILREWFFIAEPLRRFNRIWRLPYVRRIFNRLDSLSARVLFPATICVHATRSRSSG